MLSDYYMEEARLLEIEQIEVAEFKELCVGCGKLLENKSRKLCDICWHNAEADWDNE